MSLAEIQDEIVKLSEEEREILAAWLGLLKKMKTAGFRKELGKAMRRMDAGRKVTEEQVNATHQRLLSCEA